MERKQFIAKTLAALPMLAFSGFNFKTDSAKKPFLVKAGNRRSGEQMKYRGKHPNDLIISKKDTGDNLSIFLFSGQDRVGPSFHVHYHQDEFFYVVEGKYRFEVGEETFQTAKGDMIFLPRNIPHSWIQLTKKGKLLYGVQPAGTLEEFFKEMNDLKKPPTAQQSQAIHLKHGMKVIGAPLNL